MRRIKPLNFVIKLSWMLGVVAVISPPALALSSSMPTKDLVEKFEKTLVLDLEAKNFVQTGPLFDESTLLMPKILGGIKRFDFSTSESVTAKGYMSYFVSEEEGAELPAGYVASSRKYTFNFGGISPITSKDDWVIDCWDVFGCRPGWSAGNFSTTETLTPASTSKNLMNDFGGSITYRIENELKGNDYVEDFFGSLRFEIQANADVTYTVKSSLEYATEALSLAKQKGFVDWEAARSAWRDIVIPARQYGAVTSSSNLNLLDAEYFWRMYDGGRMLSDFALKRIKESDLDNTRENFYNSVGPGAYWGYQGRKLYHILIGKKGETELPASPVFSGVKAAHEGWLRGVLGQTPEEALLPLMSSNNRGDITNPLLPDLSYEILSTDKIVSVNTFVVLDTKNSSLLYFDPIVSDTYAFIVDENFFHSFVFPSLPSQFVEPFVVEFNEFSFDWEPGEILVFSDYTDVLIQSFKITGLSWITKPENGEPIFGLSFLHDDSAIVSIAELRPIPLPSSIWLFISALMGFKLINRKTPFFRPCSSG